MRPRSTRGRVERRQLLAPVGRRRRRVDHSGTASVRELRYEACGRSRSIDRERSCNLPYTHEWHMSLGSEHAQDGVIWSGLNGTHGYRPGFILPHYVINVLTTVCNPLPDAQILWGLSEMTDDSCRVVAGGAQCGDVRVPFNHMLAAKPRSPIRQTGR